ncbi:MAG: aminotransferase class V-fold PLP-dependent enzyme [Bacilli bacterium]
MTEHRRETQLIHHQHAIDETTGAVVVPVHHTSTFHQFDWENYGNWDYARSGNPTRDALEHQIALLEGGTHGFAFGSGMAAISSVVLLLQAGDHVIVPNDVYGGTFRLVTKLIENYGITYTFVDTTDLSAVEAAVQPNTRMIYLETPSNPLLAITDLKAVSEIAKRNEALVVVDNTFMTPLLQRPIELGADIVVHSATKFINGHSDVVGGLAVVRDAHLAKRVRFMQNTIGAILGPDDCYLTMRGIKTMGVRMRAGEETARRLVDDLLVHPKVKNVFYPGIESHPGYGIHVAQSSGAGACFSFELRDEAAARTFVENARIPVFAVSLGAVESILSYPARMSHASMSRSERNARGITDGLLRFSVGLEDMEDLREDFAEALKHV